jgi:hypothetical protein
MTSSIEKQSCGFYHLKSTGEPIAHVCRIGASTSASSRRPNPVIESRDDEALYDRDRRAPNGRGHEHSGLHDEEHRMHVRGGSRYDSEDFEDVDDHRRPNPAHNPEVAEALSRARAAASDSSERFRSVIKEEMNRLERKNLKGVFVQEAHRDPQIHRAMKRALESRDPRRGGERRPNPAHRGPSQRYDRRSSEVDRALSDLRRVAHDPHAFRATARREMDRLRPLNLVGVLATEIKRDPELDEAMKRAQRAMISETRGRHSNPHDLHGSGCECPRCRQRLGRRDNPHVEGCQCDRGLNPAVEHPLSCDCAECRMALERSDSGGAWKKLENNPCGPDCDCEKCVSERRSNPSCGCDATDADSPWTKKRANNPVPEVTVEAPPAAPGRNAAWRAKNISLPGATRKVLKMISKPAGSSLEAVAKSSGPVSMSQIDACLQELTKGMAAKVWKTQELELAKAIQKDLAVARQGGTRKAKTPKGEDTRDYGIDESQITLN